MYIYIISIRVICLHVVSFISAIICLMKICWVLLQSRNKSSDFALCPPYAHAHRRPVGVAGWQAMEPEERPLERSYEAAERSSFFFPSENYDIGIFRNFRGEQKTHKKKHVHKTQVARTVGHEVTLYSRYINPQSFSVVSQKNKLRSEMSCSLWMKM